MAACTIVVWGSTFIASKVLLKYYSAAYLMMMRFVIAYVVLLIARPKFPRPVIKNELRLALCGLLGCTLYFVGESNALSFTLASNVSIIVAAAPIFTSILAHFLTKDEKFHKNVLFGFIIAFLGVALVVFNGTVILKLSPAGDALALFAALCWAGYSVTVKSLLPKYDIIILTRRTMLYGFITSLPLLLFERNAFTLAPFADPGNLFCIVFLGVLGSGVCYVTWNIATKRLGVVTTNSYIYANPFITMVAAWMFLNEKISVMGAIGAVLIIAGVFLSGRKFGRNGVSINSDAVKITGPINKEINGGIRMNSTTDSFKLANGTNIPCVGFGTWQTPDGDVCINAVKTALTAGYRHIDTAYAYKNEDGVGEGIRQSGVARADIFLTSKLWNKHRGYESALKYFERSLQNLGTDYLDLFLIHWPANKKQFDNADELNRETWRAFEKLYEEGRIRAIGVSNFKEHHLESLSVTANIKPMVDQIEHHPGFIQTDVIAYCKKNGILVEAWSPLGSGALLGDERMLAMAKKYGVTLPQLLIRFCLDDGILPLPKSVTPARIESNAILADISISAEDEAFLRSKELRFGGSLDPDEVDF